MQVERKTIYLSLSFISLLSLYLYKIHLGNFAAADREAYKHMFELNFGGHFEIGFRNLAYVFNKLGIDPSLSILILCTAIFCIAFFVSWKFLSREKLHLVAFCTIFFGITSIFSIIQFRMAFAAWSTLLLLHLFDDSKKKIYLFFMPLLGFFHISMFPFAFIAIAHRLRLFSARVILILSSLGLISLIYFHGFFIETLGLQQTYMIYFDPANKNPIYFSPMVWSYFLGCLLLFFLTKSRNEAQSGLPYLGLPFSVIAFISSFDILTRFSAPFLVLTWLSIFKNLPENYLKREFYVAVEIIGLLLIPVSIMYSFYRY